MGDLIGGRSSGASGKRNLVEYAGAGRFHDSRFAAAFFRFYRDRLYRCRLSKIPKSFYGAKRELILTGGV